MFVFVFFLLLFRLIVGREALGACVGGLGPLLGPMLAVLGRSWGLCWRSWAALGAMYAVLGADQGLSWRSWGPSGRSWKRSGRKVAQTRAGKRSGKRIKAEKWPKPEPEGRSGEAMVFACGSHVFGRRALLSIFSIDIYTYIQKHTFFHKNIK